MFRSINKTWQQFCNWQRFEKMSLKKCDIVFYSEGSGDWPHLGPILEKILQNEAHDIYYLSSSADDPAKKISNSRLHFFDIGSGFVRTLLFKSLNAKVLVLSLTDLEKYFLKRSVYPVHYIYVFHSLNSTHMTYHEEAFDYYDSILCVGDYQIEEIRKREKIKNLTAKKLIAAGNPKLDSLISKARHRQDKREPADKKIEFLLAPSWGPGSFIESKNGIHYVKSLLANHFIVTVRLHPMTVRRCPELVAKLVQLEYQNNCFKLIIDMTEEESFFRADFCVSDWSGAAYEYAFARERPVLFIDTPRKIFNLNYEILEIEPFEVFMRKKIGQVIHVDDLLSLKAICDNLIENIEMYRRNIIQIKSEKIFNIEKSAQVSAEYILKFVT